MSLVHQGILPEFRTTKAMQKSTAKKHLMTEETQIFRMYNKSLRGLADISYIYIYIYIVKSANTTPKLKRISNS